MNKYLVMLVYLGRYVAMQFVEASSKKEANKEAFGIVDEFSGAWVEIIEVKNE